jgi:tripartite-type tricarboxylate transporter receptor subunit TctC
MMHWMGLAQVNYKDFKPVALVNIDPAGVSVKADAPWNTLKELLDYAKANPGKLKATGTGKGGIWDLARAGMLKTAGISVDAIPWVPSEGAAPGLAEMVAGGVPVVTCSLPEARSMIEAKKAKALAIMGEKRADIFPDVPTLKELGINWTMGAWRGVGVPKDTPDDVVKVLEKSLEKAVASADFKDFMVKNGFGIMWKPAAEYGKFMADGDHEGGRSGQIRRSDSFDKRGFGKQDSSAPLLISIYEKERHHWGSNFHCSGHFHLDADLELSLSRERASRT